MASHAAGMAPVRYAFLGTWLIQVYHQQFAEHIAQYGIDGLLKFLTQRNRQVANGQ